MTNRSYERSITLKKAVDLQVVGENILDVADFAIEKYEFEHDTTLSEELREAATEKIRDDLGIWSRISARGGRGGSR